MQWSDSCAGSIRSVVVDGRVAQPALETHADHILELGYARFSGKRNLIGRNRNCGWVGFIVTGIFGVDYSARPEVDTAKGNIDPDQVVASGSKQDVQRAESLLKSL